MGDGQAYKGTILVSVGKDAGGPGSPSKSDLESKLSDPSMAQMVSQALAAATGNMDAKAEIKSPPHSAKGPGPYAGSPAAGGSPMAAGGAAGGSPGSPGLGGGNEFAYHTKYPGDPTAPGEAHAPDDGGKYTFKYKYKYLYKYVYKKSDEPLTSDALC